ncbi:hypothetical protein PsorP6_013063 [Peronosclerospora sorghi]|uniref:Uncharacterized protein n=1 Tax=Peronosclerospora sorghi TaxID=230839 RepID=A0ACC0WHT1_9STRA|nr:hypothetical protein PsorP6_013063 [Peronosclerospora sorghi]
MGAKRKSVKTCARSWCRLFFDEKKLCVSQLVPKTLSVEIIQVTDEERRAYTNILESVINRRELVTTLKAAVKEEKKMNKSREHKVRELMGSYNTPLGSVPDRDVHFTQLRKAANHPKFCLRSTARDHEPMFASGQGIWDAVCPEITKMSKLLGPILIAGMDDNKKSMQAVSLHALHQWVRHSGKTSTLCVESLLVPLSEGLWKAVGRAELLTWAVEHVRQCEKFHLQCLVGPTVHSLMDKPSDTRESNHRGYDVCYRLIK